MTALERMEKIRQRAYQLYEARLAQGIPGTAAGDWEAAEREIAQEEPSTTDAAPPAR